MKRIFQHPDQPETGRKYWRSLHEASETPEFKEWLTREFPAGAADFEAGGVSRRDFLKLMGASMALAGVGTAACRRPEGHIMPYTKSPEWVIPGRSTYYATAIPRRTGAVPLVATTYEGRPTHLDGNKLVPGFGTASDLQIQAAVLDMYDPDRVWQYRELVTGPKGDKKANRRSKEDFLAAIKLLVSDMGGNGGAGAALLLEPSNSPTRRRLLDEVRAKYPQLMVAEYAPLNAATEIPALGAGVRIRYRFAAAKRILAVDSDFLCGDDIMVQAAMEFAAGRRVNDESTEMNRLYVVESAYTITGGMADHRLRLAPSQCLAFAQVVAETVGASMPGLPPLPAELHFDREWAVQAAHDLAANRGESLFIVGPHQPEAVRLLGLAINQALGNVGTTVQLYQAPVPAVPSATIQQLADAINGGGIETLMIVGGNPIYNAPADLNWAEVQAKAQNVVRVSFHDDETAENVNWLAPKAHFLESWSDDYTADGTYLAIQPMILPINEGISDVEFVSLLNGADLTRGPEFVRATFDQVAAGDTGEGRTWDDFLRNGFLPGTSFPAARVSISAPATPVVAIPAPTVEALEVQVRRDPKLEDGEYNNNGWLLELPDPVTKLTWDNVALVSRATGKALGVDAGKYGKARVQFGNEEGNYDLIQIEVDGRSVEMPVMISHGQADNVITVNLGWGRSRTGRVGTGAGFNVYPLLTSTSGFILPGARVTKTKPEAYMLAFAQMYNYMEGRALVREGTIEEFAHDRRFAKQLGMDAHIPPNVSLYKTPPYGQLSEHQWGMTIDLNLCTGCSACTVACQSENNIPIVGKIQVNNGREMHWIRMDRYFASADPKHPLADDNPQMIVQPVACVHCENAPCETVCPVNATVHSEDGLNVMAYNRCIGTRYCANNCPYKARRFNFFDFNDRPQGPIRFEKESWFKKPFAGRDKLELGPLTKKGMEESLKLSKNPNVTVRMRGVMEKCTYCVQRIEWAKIDQRIQAKDSPNTRIPTDTVTTACQDACATGAIIFGDIADPNSSVSRSKLEGRNYRIIEYLNTQARTSYLARVRNPNERMPDYLAVYDPEGTHHATTKARRTYDHHAHGDEHAGEGAEEHGVHHAEAMPGHNTAGAGAVAPGTHGGGH